MRRSFLLLLSTAALAASASATVSPNDAVPLAHPVLAVGDSGQRVLPTVHLGDGTIRGSRLRPFQVAWSATFYPDNAPPIVAPGMWLQTLDVGQWKGRKVLVRAIGGVVVGHDSHQIRGYIAHVAIVDPQTLAPIWSQHHDADGGTETWAVDGTHVEWRHTGGDAGAKEIVERFDTPVPAYDLAGAIIPFYLRALPRRVGLSGAIPVIGDPKQPIRALPFKVDRKERIRAGRLGMVDAWVVECPDPAAGILHFWLSERFPYPLKMEIPATPGVPRQTYDLAG